MAYEAHDGRRFANHQVGKYYDEVKKPKAAVAEHDEPDGDEKGPEDVAAEHGAAHTVEIHSHHPDGHVHKAEHHHPEEAADHVHKIMGQGEPDEDDEPDGDEFASQVHIPGFQRNEQ